MNCVADGEAMDPGREAEGAKDDWERVRDASMLTIGIGDWKTRSGSVCADARSARRATSSAARAAGSCDASQSLADRERAG